MPDIDITIPKPIIIAPAKFKVRYREYPSGIFTAYQDEDNDPFTLTGLAAGQYEMEIIYVTQSAVECTPVLYRFTVVDDYSCATFTPAIVQSGNAYFLEITYGAVVNPACGFEITYNQGSANTVVTYNPLPTSPLTIPLAANQDVNLTIKADLCNGNAKFCYEDTIEAIEPDCTPLVLTNAELKYNGPTSTSPNTWFIRLQIQNSSPTTPMYVINVQETSNTSPLAPDSRTFNYIGSAYSPLQTLFFGGNQVFPKGIFKTIPNNNPDFPPEYVENCISYTGVIVDVCGVSHPFTVGGLWTPDGSGIAGQGTFIENGC